MQKITTFLWFDDDAEQAIEHYVSIFGDSKMLDVQRSGEGKLFGATFQLEGQEFMALNGGPHFKFNEAISLFVRCETQEEVDSLWSKLTAGGQESRCGWLKDKFGLSWQIIPTILPKLLSDPDRAKAKRAMDAMMQMKKLDIAKLKQAAEGA